MPGKRNVVPADWFETVEDRIWLPPDDQGEEEARFIRKALFLRKGQRVLDAPCGAGRIAFHLAKVGCQVTGLDIRARFITRARSRFRKARLHGQFRVADLRSIDDESCFHGIYTWFGSFGYFSDTENLALVQRFARALRPGGRLILEQVNRERILRNFRRKGVVGPIITYAYWDRATQRSINHRVVDGVRDLANSSSMRLYTPAQMCALLETAGLQVEAVYGYPDGGRFTRGSRRMAVVGRRPQKS